MVRNQVQSRPRKRPATPCRSFYFHTEPVTGTVESQLLPFPTFAGSVPPPLPPARGLLPCCFMALEKSLKLDALHVPHQHGHLRTLGRLSHERVLAQQALRLGRRAARALAIWSVVEAQRPRRALWLLVQLL